MMVKIEFETDNAAFEDDYNREVAFVLSQATLKLLEEREYARKEGCAQEPATLRDSNGNKIGYAHEE